MAMYDRAEVYLRTIDWKARLGREVPVLKEMIEAVQGKERTRVLDLGCGPGMHLRELATLLPDQEFHGLDVEEDMINKAIEVAKEKGMDIKYTRGDIFEDSSVIDGTFDFVFSLGNAVLLIMSVYNPELVVEKIASLVNPGGYLFFQILNNECPRQGYMNSKVVKMEDGREFFTLKRFDPDLDKHIMNVEFVLLEKEAGEMKHSFNVKKNSWPMLSLSDFESVLGKHGFSTVNAWESYDKKPFDPKTSDSLLYLAKKEKRK
ncbi:MAG: class I SAM-dependent methyltransferase [Candidatus Hodarchaeota archaeon]